jgi:hypothetical protein
MSTIIYPASQQVWSGTGVPSSTIVLGQGGTIYLGDFYIDANTLALYNFTSLGSFDSDTQTYSDCTFQEIATSVNVLSVLNNAGWNLNTSRSYSLRSSPAFSTAYTPSVTNDTLVCAIVSVTSTVLTAGTVLFQVNSGSGFVTICEASITGLAATNIQTITCLVPANASYQLVNSSGTASIVSLNELQL